MSYLQEEFNLIQEKVCSMRMHMNLYSLED